jgi:hypothetical protein
MEASEWQHATRGCCYTPEVMHGKEGEGQICLWSAGVSRCPSTTHGRRPDRDSITQLAGHAAVGGLVLQTVAQTVSASEESERDGERETERERAPERVNARMHARPRLKPTQHTRVALLALLAGWGVTCAQPDDETRPPLSSPPWGCPPTAAQRSGIASRTVTTCAASASTSACDPAPAALRTRIPTLPLPLPHASTPAPAARFAATAAPARRRSGHVFLRACLSGPPATVALVETLPASALIFPPARTAARR